MLIQRGNVVCPNQELIAVTYPITNSSDETSHPKVAITQPGVIQEIVYVKKSRHCASDIMIVGREEDMKSVIFSKSELVDVVFNLIIL